MSQMTLDEVFARRSDPDTSKAAVRGDSYGPCTVRVLDALIALGDATAGEIQRSMEGPLAPDRSSVSRRLTSLKRAGLVRDTGARRDGDRGATQAVYTATQEGRAWR